MGHTEKTDYCESCLFETDDLKEVDCYARVPSAGPFTPDDQKVWGWLCEVCRDSYAGMAYQFPRNYENQPVLAMIAWGVNHIASLIKNEAKE